MKFSLKINWLIDSYLQNTNDPKITKLYDRLLQKIEVTLVNANRSKMNRISHHQKELHTRSSVIFDQSIDKELRLKYFEICVKFYENLKAMCEKLKSFPKEIDRPNNRNVIMRNYLFVYNSNIISMREEMQNQFGAEYSKTVIKNFFKGMILPFDDFNSTMDEHNSIIVRMIPEYSFCFSTKARVPVKICAECVRANECLQWDDLFKDDGNKIKKSIDTGSANVDVNIISTETEDFLIEDNLDEKQENGKIKYNKTLHEFMKEIKLREEKKLTSASNCHSSMENKIEKDIEANEDFSVTDFNPEVTNPFGRKWTDVCKEIRKTSPYRNFESYSIKNFIAKADDDLRQELMAMQLISRFNDIFTKAEIPLKIRPYEILITSSSSGLIEFLPNTNSIDGTKKKLPSYWSLNSFFRNFYSEFFEEAQKNFAESLAAYSLVCYYIQIKDRHNGNILLDLKGNVIHIDFGFILGISPGNLNFESAPFKLTAEYVEILDGLESPIFEYFKSLMFRGMIEAKKNVNTFIKIVEIMTRGIL
jgi:phosphatidylinositol 4-kinase